jgi:hypothetical protein
LWVASAAPAPHIRVVSGIEGSLLHIKDPAPVNKGSSYARAFTLFFGKMEKLGEQENNQPNPVYVAYLK